MNTSGDIDISGTMMDRATAYGIYFDKVRVHVPFWRRAWFLISAAPRYLLTGYLKERPITK